jgi:parvulin-like peptidyl-prolyl isomerase
VPAAPEAGVALLAASRISRQRLEPPVRTRVRLLTASVTAALLLAACSPLPPGSAAAVVGDTRIPREAIERAVAGLDLDGLRAGVDAGLPAELEGAERTAAVDEEMAAVLLDTQRRILDLYIRREIVLIVAEDLGVEATAEDREAAREALIASVGGPEALSGVLADAGFSEEVFDEVIVEQEALLVALRRDVLAGAELEVREPRHILVASQEEAEEVIAELAAGADFAELAAARSQDPGSAPQGGALRPGRRGGWLPEVDDAVWTAQIGEVVGPVQTQAGFHVIEVVDEATLEADDLPEQQVQQLVAGELDARFFTAVSETAVQVDPAFGVWSSDPEDPSLRPSDPVGQAPTGPTSDGLGLSEEELAELLEELEDGS